MIDHDDFKRYVTDPGLDGHVAALTMRDIGTGFVMCQPVQSHTATTTVLRLGLALGSDPIGLVYSENHPSLIKAVAELGVAP